MVILWKPILWVPYSYALSLSIEGRPEALIIGKGNDEASQKEVALDCIMEAVCNFFTILGLSDLICLPAECPVGVVLPSLSMMPIIIIPKKVNQILGSWTCSRCSHIVELSDLGLGALTLRAIIYVILFLVFWCGKRNPKIMITQH